MTPWCCMLFSTAVCSLYANQTGKQLFLNAPKKRRLLFAPLLKSLFWRILLIQRASVVRFFTKIEGFRFPPPTPFIIKGRYLLDLYINNELLQRWIVLNFVHCQDRFKAKKIPRKKRGDSTDLYQLYDTFPYKIPLQAWNYYMSLPRYWLYKSYYASIKKSKFPASYRPFI